MSRALAGNFRASYDSGGHKASLSLNSTDHKVSQRSFQIQGHEYCKATGGKALVGSGGSKRHLLRPVTTFAVRLWS